MSRIPITTEGRLHYLTATETVSSVFLCSTKMLCSWPEREHFYEQNEQQWRQCRAERKNQRSVYTKVDGVAADIELPLNLLITGNLKGKPDNTPLDERTAIAINRYNLNAVISEADIEREFVVPAELSDAPNEQMYVNLKVKSMDDLSPDHIASQVPEIKRLLELREALVALKSPLGNIPAFRAQLQALLENEDSREQLIQELGIAAQK